MNCETVRTLIDAYLDSELDFSKSIEVETHLASCEKCRLTLESRQQLSRAIKAAATYAPVPLSLRTTLRKETHPRPKLRFGLATTALAFAIGMALVLGFWQPWKVGNSLQDRIIGDMFSHHREAMACNRLVEMRSDKPKEVRSWFTSRVDYSPKVATPPEEQFKLLGGRMEVIAGRTVPVVAYTSNSHEIDVYVTSYEFGDINDSDRDGQHLMAWDDCGLHYWIVSDDPRGDLGALRQAFWGPRRDR